MHMYIGMRIIMAIISLRLIFMSFLLSSGDGAIISYPPSPVNGFAANPFVFLLYLAIVRPAGQKS